MERRYDEQEEFTLPSGAKAMAPGQSGVEGVGIPKHPEPQELESIDFTDKTLIQSKLGDYESQFASESVENAVVITQNGKTYRCIGTQNQVFPNTDLGEQLRGGLHEL